MHDYAKYDGVWYRIVKEFKRAVLLMDMTTREKFFVLYKRINKYERD